MIPARRLLLSADELAGLQRLTGARLPPGFALSGAPATDDPKQQALPSVTDDLAVLSRPEVAVLLRASRPGLDVTACLAVSGPRGAGLLRTGSTAVELSAFGSADLASELARIVPAGDPARPGGRAEEVPLDQLLDPTGTRWQGRPPGALRAVVVGVTAVGSVEWLWDRGGWTSLDALPARGGRPWLRLEPVGPGDLARRLAPLLAAAA